MQGEGKTLVKNNEKKLAGLRARHEGVVCLAFAGRLMAARLINAGLICSALTDDGRHTKQ